MSVQPVKKPLPWGRILLGGLAAIIGLALLSAVLNGADRGGLPKLLLALLAVVGVMLAGKRMKKIYPRLALFVFNLLLAFVLLELASTVFFALERIGSRQGSDLDEADSALDYYDTQTWGATYLSEREALREDYHPYIIWRQAPFQGEVVNINADGLRLTTDTDCSAGAYRVFVFGGSTVWGMGAPDDGTIPSHLQRILAERHSGAVCVVNYGEIGYVSTQELIAFIGQLQRGNLPDEVIFYDGVNDVFAMGQTLTPASHQFLEVIASKVEGGGYIFFEKALQSSDLIAALVRILLQMQGGGALELLRINDIERRADEIVAVYLANYDLMSALSAHYGFDFTFIWQPVIYIGEKPLTPQEETITEAFSDDLIALYEATYTRMAAVAEDYEHLYYAANLFDSYTEWLWIDYFHVTPEANAIVAAYITDVMRLGTESEE